MSSSPQPVRFYVPSSSAEPIQIDVAHSGLRMVLVNRESVHRLGEEWRVLGIYFLLGPLPDPDRFCAYVGEVGRRDLILRLKEHAAHKEWWNRALLIASASDEFNSAEIGWLEGRLFDVLTVAVAAEVMNKGRPGDDSIAPKDRGVLERYVEPIIAALRACGASTDSAEQPRSGPSRKPTRYSETVKDLIDAHLLTPGTTLRPRRKGLRAEALVLPDGTLELEGQIYTAVSTAAQAVSGNKAEAGWEFWGIPSQNGSSFTSLHALRDRLRNP